ncbi:sulfurtransferase [Pseudomonas sp. TH05]|uniref:sulfurtransferase n=1 Tax=unclassified Pseudomonas TaxID=196821 RepID=UPI0009977397|nr:MULTISPECIES: rhodanese-like domain-containing protein [unclassified Pseudomonas]MBK5540258.1 sulfurtransferase [Pseudomonas sp. TH07]MBK5560305.1 sulfurtransferase [Pseudomonas sp. TH05]OOV89728.1 sulfurtransferase [Pseudomonas sp. MF4836]
MKPILISPTELAGHLGQPQWRVLDASVELPSPRFDQDYRVASGREGWRQAHIPGALHADLLHDLALPEAPFSFAWPGPQALANGLARLGIAASSRLVIYDRGDGFWAARLWWMLRSVGIHAQVLDGGLSAWRDAGLPLEQGESTPVPVAPQRLEQGPGFWIERQGVQAVLAGERPGLLICALSAALFHGTTASRYARRGHLPGSLNVPARTVFDAQGRYLPRRQLQQELGSDLLQAPGPLVLYCGGGISAAALALALTRVGRDDVLLYDGSLQEWAADSDLPMTTGATPA